MKLDLGIESQVQGQMQPAVKALGRMNSSCLASPRATQASHESVARQLCDHVFKCIEERGRKHTAKGAPLRPRRLREPSTNGILSHPRGQFSYRCVLRDISEIGARVVLPSGSPLANRMYVVHFTAETAYDSDVIWFDGNEAGLAFRRALSLRRLKHPELVFLRKLWLEHMTE